MIYDMARAINPPVNALGAYAQGMQLGQQATATKDANALAKARKGYGRNAFMASQAEGGQFDAAAYARAVAQDAAAAGDFDYFSNAQDVVGKSQKNNFDSNKDGREGQKHQFEQLGSQLKLQGQLLGGVRDQATWEQALQTARANGIDVSNIPTQYSPKVVQDITQMTLTAQDRLDQEWKRRGYDLDVAQFGYQQRNDAANRSVTIRGQNMTDARAREANKNIGSAKPLPLSATKALLENLRGLNNVKTALSLIKGEKVGNLQGDKGATGLFNYLPDQIVQRLDKKGIDTRAAVANLGSLVIHERSGAAVTAAEFPRLKPFIPLATDSPETVERKLTRFEQEYNLMIQEQILAYEQSGFAVPDLSSANPSQPSSQEPESNAFDFVAPPNPRDYVGQIIEDESGQRMESDGKTWRILK